MFGWGTGDYVASRLSKNVHPAAIGAFYTIITDGLILLICAPFGLPEFRLTNTLGFIGVSYIMFLAFYTMTYAFKIGKTGVVSAISNSYAIVTALLTVLLFNSPLSALAILSIGIVVIGIAMISASSEGEGGVKKLRLDRSIALSLLAMIMFGTGFALYEIVATHEWYQNAILSSISGMIAGLSLFLFIPFKNKRQSVMTIGKMKLAYFSAVLNAAAFIGLFLAFKYTSNVSVPSAIAAASPIVTITLARLFDGEQLKLVQKIGIATTIGGITLLSVTR